MSKSICMVAAVCLALPVAASAVDIETVPVGNAGNPGEWSGESYGGFGPDRICGAVAYEYKMGRYEVTNAQYTEFLNAVDADGSDAYGLYNSNMGFSSYGGITFTTGDPDGSKYAVRPGRGDKPVNYVSFWDACRFANWLHNGQGSGDTETGAYTLASDAIANNTVSRNVDWQWAVCGEDEWYKGAYYHGGSGLYYDYPTGSDTAPTAEVPAGTNMSNGSANYDVAIIDVTDVGAYDAKPSDSPYGSYDQGGNVWEWNEAIVSSSYRGLRGGSFGNDEITLRAASRYRANPTLEDGGVGFRVSEVPEPTTMALLALGGVGMLLKRRARK